MFRPRGSDKKWFKDRYNVVVLVFTLSLLIMHICRMWGAIYQMTSEEIRHGCLYYDVENEVLRKNPFALDCLRGLGKFMSYCTGRDFNARKFRTHYELFVGAPMILPLKSLKSGLGDF